MTSNLRSLLERTRTFVASSLPGTPPPQQECTTTTITTKSTLFPIVDPAIDGEDCLHDCAGCPVQQYPRAFTKIGIEETEDLWSVGIKGYAVHAIVATGKTDWIRDVCEEKGSVMEALGKLVHDEKKKEMKIMISASNMPPPPEYYTAAGGEGGGQQPTMVLILPSFTVVENVTPQNTPELLQRFMYPGPTTQTPLLAAPEQVGQPELELSGPNPEDDSVEVGDPLEGNKDQQETLPHHHSLPEEITPGALPSAAVNALDEAVAALALQQPQIPPSQDTDTTPPGSVSGAATADYTLTSHPCPHDYVVLLCSHKHRDARCGISAPLLAKEFARHLRPLGLHRDLNDTRPGGVGLYFVNHVGGHKYAANVLVYRKADGMGVWLARIAPKHVEGIVKYTILQGKIVHPDMIRGGFNRKTGAVSW